LEAARGNAVRRGDRSHPWEEPDQPSPSAPTFASMSPRCRLLPSRRRAAPPIFTDACTSAHGHSGEERPLLSSVKPGHRAKGWNDVPERHCAVTLCDARPSCRAGMHFCMCSTRQHRARRCSDGLGAGERTRAPHVPFVYRCAQARARPRSQGVKPSPFSSFCAVPAALAGVPPVVSRGDANGVGFPPWVCKRRSPLSPHACSRGNPCGAPPVVATPNAPTGSRLPAVVRRAPAHASAALPLKPILPRTHMYPCALRGCEPPAFARSSSGRRPEPLCRPAIAPAMASASPQRSPSSGAFLSSPSRPIGPGRPRLGARGPGAMNPRRQ
jgi:hypothetical protein